MDILKLTAKKAPYSTLAAFLVYFIFSKVIEVNQSETILMIIVGLTFTISLFLLVFGSRKKDKVEPSDNFISGIKTDKGDVFIGNKNTRSNKIPPQNSEIKDVDINTGDVFIGNKKSLEDE
ncbi:hypothetical protein [Paraglaciecola sp. MB-3u-78]|jgi:hypothetical protein|uniref:hypothetical protein n=1 Tax=Paraglaciecola sp. MB-3u-78 TaxID=2058332 RepID=UPI000C31BDCD|nr:hypothetical protein [Paraglaciecola sp. MB-3u-78]PKG93313.1 hypothetical protein CXF95_27485 [Paraglaciecola sp. MB-3u-78]